MVFDNEAIHKASRLVKQYETTDPFEITQHLGIQVIDRDCEKIKGLYAYILRNRFIVVDSKLSRIERRVVLSHELGHDQNDRGSCFGSYMDEMCLSQSRHYKEINANYFAAELLIQDIDFFEMTESGYTCAQIASELEVFPELVALKNDILIRKGHKLNPIDVYSKDFLGKALG